ncbi:MAG: hypothetical protein JSU96_00615 [Acidobacteriota bacterium]|nr:MAG: hypothetical protein JSU96_00615 [Acidobacteriota bacterium]
MLMDLQRRLGKFHLTLHEQKTRLFAFGRWPSLSREQQGRRRCETFSFLGLTHYCGRTRDGRFMVKYRTDRQRLAAKLKALRLEAKRRMHLPIGSQHQWLCRVLRGHYAYFGLSSNYRSLSRFSAQVQRIWYRALNRRTQRHLSWARYNELLNLFPLPAPKLNHSLKSRTV